MKRLLSGLLLPLLMWGCASARPEGESRNPEKWEYRVVYLPGEDAKPELDRNGDQGWELVSIYHYGSNPIAAFKRPKR